VFTRAKVAVFVDGCFWHACLEHGTAPAANADWWAAKLARNVERDADTDWHLVEAGWSVVRVWETRIQRLLVPAWWMRFGVTHQPKY